VEFVCDPRFAFEAFIGHHTNSDDHERTDRGQPVAPSFSQLSSSIATPQEKEVTASINRLYVLAIETSDFSPISLLDWLVADQVEEESTVQQIIDPLLAPNHPGARP